MKKVLVVVLNMNGLKLLKRNLQSVVETDYDDFDVLVVDNASTDGSVEYVKRKFPDVFVEINGENLGFGRANNVAFSKYPGYEFYVLLNNDVNVEPEWLKELLIVVDEDKKIAVIGPKMLYPKKRNGQYVINSAGGIIDKWERGFDRYDGCIDNGRYDGVEEVDFVCGGAMMLRSKALQEVGVFDERMLIYHEDVDLSLRMSEGGWKVVYCGKSNVYHEHMGTVGGWSSTRRTYLSNINRMKSIQRRKSWFEAIIEGFRTVVEWIVVSLYSKIGGPTYREVLTKGLYSCKK